MIVKTRDMRWTAIPYTFSKELRGIGCVLMKKWFVFLVCLWAFQASAQGTYPAASCSVTDVTNAIKAEQAHHVDGDIISIPAGSCTWSGAQVSSAFNNSVTIQGAGAISATAGGASTTGSDLTILNDSSGSGSMWAITTAAGKSLRFTGIAISGTVINANGMLNVSGTSTSVRIDHCHFTLASSSGSVGVYIGGSVLGVADHNYFQVGAGTLTNDFALHNGQSWNGDAAGFGDKSWADADHFGTNQFFFVEDTLFSQGDILDGHDGARYVIRHSTYQGTHGQFYNHGLDDGRARSMRAAEIYQNTWTRSAPDGAPSYSNNGGTLLYWGNTSTNYRYLVGIDYTRKNNATYGYGTTPSGWGNCNGAGTSTKWDFSTTGPCMDQPARGAGNLITGNFPNVVNSTAGTIAWPSQALSPIYVWNNNFSDAGFFPEGYMDNQYATLLTDNVDYYQQFNASWGEPGTFNGTKGVGQGLLSARPSTCAAGPGGNTPGVGYWGTDTATLYVCNPTNTWTVYYAPYTYPHPLTQSSVGTAVAAPTNLSVIVQ